MIPAATCAWLTAAFLHFNSLFEMPRADYYGDMALLFGADFNSLFEMLGFLGFCLCWFLNVSVVALGFLMLRALCWFCGGCLFVCGGVGGVVVVLVEVGFGVGLRFYVARRFIYWISALHSLLGGRVERFDRYKTRFTRRFINADTYITYI